MLQLRRRWTRRSNRLGTADGPEEVDVERRGDLGICLGCGGLTIVDTDSFDVVTVVGVLFFL